jgi:hypothetical protein
MVHMQLHDLKMSPSSCALRHRARPRPHRIGSLRGRPLPNSRRTGRQCRCSPAAEPRGAPEAQHADVVTLGGLASDSEWSTLEELVSG